MSTAKSLIMSYARPRRTAQNAGVRSMLLTISPAAWAPALHGFSTPGAEQPVGLPHTCRKMVAPCSRILLIVFQPPERPLRMGLLRSGLVVVAVKACQLGAAVSSLLAQQLALLH